MLFDLEADATETTNLAMQRPELVERMVAEIIKWNADFKNGLRGTDDPARLFLRVDRFVFFESMY